jgi:twinkle protein
MLQQGHREWLATSRKIAEGVIDRLAETGVLDSRGPRIVFRTRGVDTPDGECVKTKLLNPKPGEGQPKWVAEPGGETRLFNEEILEDVAAMAADDFAGLVITEGEIDCLTALSCTAYAVSLQNGAIATPDHEGWVQFHCRSKELSRVRWFVLAVDDDEKGRACRELLLGYLGKGRCKIVEYPKGCKDLNDVAQQHGLEVACNVIRTAKPYPLEGVYKLSDYPDPGEFVFYDNEIPGFENAFKPFRGSLVVIAGAAFHGKSTLVNAMLGDWNRLHGLKIAMASFEMPVKPFLQDNFTRYYYGRTIRPTTPEALRSMWHPPAEALAYCDNWLERNFTFISANGLEELPTLDWLLEKYDEAIARFGIDVCVLDPWNKLDLGDGHNEVKLERRAVNRFKKFCDTRSVIGVVVTHPSTIVRDARTGGVRAGGMLDIAGGAHWANMADFIAMVHRPDVEKDEVDVHVRKAKFYGSGKVGTYPLVYRRVLEYFEAGTASAPPVEESNVVALPLEATP